MKKLVFLTLIIILTACSFGASSELERNRQAWLDLGIAHYRFSVFVGCFCPFGEKMPLTVEVQNGEVVSMAYSDGIPVAPTDPSYETFTHYATIERIFSVLEAGLKGDADEVTVTYDSARGFPSEIYFDYIKDAVDDELSITVSNFEVLE